MYSLKSFLVAWLMVLVPSTSMAASLSIISYGDSITAGLQRSSSDARSCPSGVVMRFRQCFGNGAEGVGPYQPRLKNRLRADDHSVLIYNYGISGIRTDEMLNDLNAILNARSASNYVLLMGGANDAYANFSRHTVKANLLAMVNRIKSRDKIPVLATVTPNRNSSSFIARIASYNDQIKEIARDHNVVLSDQFAALNPAWGANHSGDNLHISNAGYVKMADEWYEALNKTLRRVAVAPMFLLLLGD